MPSCYHLLVSHLPRFRQSCKMIFHFFSCLFDPCRKRKKTVLKYDEGNTCSKQLHDFFSGCQSSLNNFMSFRQVCNKIAFSKNYTLFESKGSRCQLSVVWGQMFRFYLRFPSPKKKLTASLPLKMNLVGGFKCFLFSLLFGGKIPILTNIFQRGWTHQLGMVGRRISF